MAKKAETNDRNETDKELFDQIVPQHYRGKDDPYEPIKVIESWGFGFKGGNALKYICRAGKKKSSTLLIDLRKAIEYLDRLNEHDFDNQGSINLQTVKEQGLYMPEQVAQAWKLPKELSQAVEMLFWGKVVSAQAQIKLYLQNESEQHKEKKR